MLNNTRQFLTSFKYLLLIFVFVVGLITIVASGGGGDSDDDSSSTEDTTDDTTDDTTAYVYLAYDATTVPTVTSFTDTAYDLADATLITLNGTTITVSGSGAANVTIEGAVATITASGTYRITGTLTNGQVKVDVPDTDTDTGDVRLYLDGVDITSTTASPVDIESAARVIMVLADGTANKLTDGTSNSSSDADGEAIDASLFSKDDLVIYSDGTGTGSLTVDANYLDGIKCKDGLTIASGTITVASVDDGIIGKNYVSVQDADIFITAGGDGLKSTNDGTDTQGYIVIGNGIIDITAEADAVQAETHVAVYGGTFDIYAGGGTSAGAISDTDTETTAKGFKANVGITINGGTFTMDTRDDSFNSDDTIIINGGTFNISSADDAMHAELALTINDGVIDVSTCYEGIESLVITINNGEIHVFSSDDPINATDGSGSMMSTVGWLYINGGYMYLQCANADGFDSNGTVAITGGEIIINGPVSGGNGILDYGSFTMTGGYMIGAGTSDMAQAPGGQTSTQNALLLIFAQKTAPTLFHIETSAGTEVVTFLPAKDYASIVLSSSLLVNGTTYKVYFGGTYTGGTVKDGLYTGGTYNDDGVEDTTLGFTVTGLVSQVGTAAGGGGRGGSLP